MISTFSLILSNFSNINSVRYDNILYSSILSSALKLISSKLNLDTLLGSMKTVVPFDDASKIVPSTSFLYEDFIGITYLSFLFEIINS